MMGGGASKWNWSVSDKGVLINPETVIWTNCVALLTERSSICGFWPFNTWSWRNTWTRPKEKSVVFRLFAFSLLRVSPRVLSLRWAPRIQVVSLEHLLSTTSPRSGQSFCVACCGTLCLAIVASHIWTDFSPAQSTLTHIVAHLVIIAAILAACIRKHVSASAPTQGWCLQSIVKNVVEARTWGSCSWEKFACPTNALLSVCVHASRVIARATTSCKSARSAPSCNLYRANLSDSSNA